MFIIELDALAALPARSYRVKKTCQYKSKCKKIVAILLRPLHCRDAGGKPFTAADVLELYADFYDRLAASSLDDIQRILRAESPSVTSTAGSTSIAAVPGAWAVEGDEDGEGEGEENLDGTPEADVDAAFVYATDAPGVPSSSAPSSSSSTSGLDLKPLRAFLLARVRQRIGHSPPSPAPAGSAAERAKEAEGGVRPEVRSFSRAP